MSKQSFEVPRSAQQFGHFRLKSSDELPLFVCVFSHRTGCEYPW